MHQSLVPHPAGGGSTELGHYQGGGMPAGLGDPAAGGMPWGRYISAIRRYRWLILVLTIGGAGAGVLATRFLKPTYTVSATIFVEKAPSTSGPIRPEGLLENSGWGELVRSWVVLDSTVVRLRLYLQTE